VSFSVIRFPHSDDAAFVVPLGPLHDHDRAVQFPNRDETILDIAVLCVAPCQVEAGKDDARFGDI
jgi:hypothetical protein